MEKKTAVAERETDGHGKRIFYDIFATRHSRFIKHVQPHTHTYFEIGLVTEGVAVDSCGESPVYIHTDEVIFITPNAVHNLSHAPEYGKFYSNIMVKFSPMFLYPLDATKSDIHSLFTPPRFDQPIYIFRRETPEAKDLGELLRGIYREYSEKQLGYEPALRAKLTELYLYLVRHLALQPDGLDSDADEKISADSTMKLSKAVSFMEENYVYNISMQEVAEEVGMDYYQFSRFFQRMTNKSFSDYLSDIRYSHARKMLLTGEKNVSEVAMECGFDYLSYFTSKFRRRYGMTPREFQQKYSKKKIPENAEAIAGTENADSSGKGSDKK